MSSRVIISPQIVPKACGYTICEADFEGKFDGGHHLGDKVNKRLVTARNAIFLMRNEVLFLDSLLFCSTLSTLALAL